MEINAILTRKKHGGMPGHDWNFMIRQPSREIMCWLESRSAWFKYIPLFRTNDHFYADQSVWVDDPEMMTVFVMVWLDSIPGLKPTFWKTILEELPTAQDRKVWL